MTEQDNLIDCSS